MTTKYTDQFRRWRTRASLIPAFGLTLLFSLPNPAPATEAESAATGGVATGVTPCTITTPSLSLSPGSIKSGADPTLAYTVSLTNNDSKNCGASAFDLTVTYLPGGWTEDLSTHTLSLMSGAKGTATLSVSPAGDNSTNSVKLQVAVSDAREPTHARTVLANNAANDMPTVVGENAGQPTTASEPVAFELSNQNTVSRNSGTDNIGPAGKNVVYEGQTTAADGGDAENADRLTQRLTGLLTAYSRAGESASANALDELVAVAEERHTLLAGLIANDPGTLLRVAVPTAVRDRMPPAARAFVEQRVDLEGKLEVRYEDYPDGSARLRQSLSTDGKQISLYFNTGSPGLTSGNPVSASGVKLDDAMALESGGNILTLASGGGNSGGSNGGSPAPTQNTLGEQKTLVILVNFQDLPTTPYTVADAQGMFFGTANDFFKENSYGQTWLSGTVFGWYTIPDSVTTCNMSQIATDAQNAAVTAGVTLSDYTRYVYAFPYNGVCGWAGSSYVGGTPSQSWINGDSLDSHIVDHELGHAFGLWHSHLLDCGTTATIGTNCSVAEYGDLLDVMGVPQTASPQYNAFHKERLGWLNNGGSPSIETVQSSGTYTITPYELGGSGPNALKILKSTDPTTGAKTWYYLEARQAIGFDAFLTDWAYYTQNETIGVLIHLGTDGNGNSSDLLDMTPTTPTSTGWFDPSLAAGQSFQDSDAGVSFTTDWVTSGGAAVSVLFSAPGGASTNDQSALSVATNLTSYSPGQTVSIAATATEGSSPAANVAVSFIVTKANGDRVTGSANTGKNGIATYKFRLKRNDPLGTYITTADAAINGISLSATTDFTFQ